MWTAPVLAQAQDPLAPLTGTPAPQSGVVITPTYPPPAASTRGPAPQQQPINAVGPAPVPFQPLPPPVTVAAPKDWRGVFDAIDSGNWYAAQAGIATLPRSILTPLAKAELYTAKGSPVVDLGSLQALIAEAPELPQADQLALMAFKRGATTPLLVIPERATINLGAAPVRYKTRPVQGEPVADQLRSILDPLIKADDAAGAEAQMLIYGPQLSVEARAEAGQRIAFVYYVLGLDADARRVADTWREGATSEWAAQAAWVSGLAS